ncbi:ankyrin repeat protein, partial [Teladorsagia circumcincta]
MDMDGDEETINIQIYVPEIQVRKCLTVGLDDFVWDVKRKLLATLPQALPQAFNYGLFLPPCDGRAGKFLLEDRVVRDYPFHDCVPYLEGETPLTLAAGVPSNRAVLVALVGGGAHIDFRNSEGQTAMHKAAFLSSCENVKALLELGASPNYRDPIGLTPLYYNMLTTDSNDQVAEMLLREAADIGITDMHGNHEIHQSFCNRLSSILESTFARAVQNFKIKKIRSKIFPKPDCARVLLFRGANHLAVNKQGQTALHVAHIVGTTAVADVIASHNPSASVPYRGTPQYSTRRRLNSSLSKRRSLSQSSLYSQDIYGTPQSQRSKPPQAAPSPTPSRISHSTITPSEYGTMRRFTPGMAPGHEANVPRILVIPRGPKGFGFILRGAKHVTSPMDFEPSPLSPALQFFEGVDMSGMAMRAGLRPGGVITVDPSLPMSNAAMPSRPRSGGNEEYYAPGQLRSNYGETRCASVKQRHGGGRRISAAELESLMIRQGERHNYQPIPYDQESIGSQTPKKYNSVSDMKRRKQRAAPSPQGLQRSYDYQNNQPMNSIYGSPMKTYSSSPDIPHMNSFELAEDETSSTTSQNDDRLGYVQHSQSGGYFQSGGDYTRPFRPAFRPKTPPPPPPPPVMSIPQNMSSQ